VLELLQCATAVPASARFGGRVYARSHRYSLCVRYDHFMGIDVLRGASAVPSDRHSVSRGSARCNGIHAASCRYRAIAR